MSNIPDGTPAVNSDDDWISQMSGSSLGDAHCRYYHAMEAAIVARAIASHECNECCGITYDPMCPLWSDSVHSLLRPRTDPRYQAAADRVPPLAAKLVADTEFMAAARPELEALASAADLEGGLFLRLAAAAWRGATEAERAAFMAEIAHDLRAMIRHEVRALLDHEEEGTANGHT
jgi:hypothetical protein